MKLQVWEAVAASDAGKALKLQDVNCCKSRFKNLRETFTRSKKSRRRRLVGVAQVRLEIFLQCDPSRGSSVMMCSEEDIIISLHDVQA